MATNQDYVGHSGKHYRLEDEPLAGGMGAVRRVTCIEDEQSYALKTLTHPSLEASALEAEAQALESVRDYHVVRYVDYGAEPEAFLVMEYAADGNLEDRLHDAQLAARPVELAQAIDWLDQMLAGLGAVHAADLIHRDLKPANLLFSAEVLKVADFGIARIADASTVSGTFRGWGTDFYRPPEGWLGDAGPRPTDAYDLYTVGVIAYEILAGQLPFIGDREQLRRTHLFAAAPMLSDIRPDLPAQLTTIILRLLAKAPADRPQSASDVRDLLAEITKVGSGEDGGREAGDSSESNVYAEDIRRRSAEMAARLSNEEAAALEAAEQARSEREIAAAGIRHFEQMFSDEIEEFKTLVAPHGVMARKNAEGWLVEVQHSPRKLHVVVTPISFEAPQAPGKVVLFGHLRITEHGNNLGGANLVGYVTGAAPWIVEWQEIRLTNHPLLMSQRLRDYEPFYLENHELGRHGLRLWGGGMNSFQAQVIPLESFRFLDWLGDLVI